MKTGYIWRGLTCFVVGCLLETSAHSQVSAKQETVPKFSSRSELVLIPVIVHDRFRKHVGGIDRQRFAILDNGKARAISVFEEVHTSTNVAAPRRAANEFGNYLTDSRNSPRVTILLLDLLTTRFQEQARTKEYLLKYISRNLSPGEPTTLLVLGARGLRQVHNFTTDAQVLIDAVRNLQTEINSQLSSPSDTGADGLMTGLTSAGTSSGTISVAEEMAMISATMTNAMQGLEELRQSSLALDSLQALEMIAHGYSGVPGRKSLVWITGGPRWPNENTLRARQFREHAEQVFKILATANIAVYPVDVEGLVAPGMLPPGQGIPDPRTAVPTIRPLDVRMEYHDTFRLISSATGGRPCINNNDVANCLQRASSDSESYYVLGFYLPPSERNTGQHKLSVKVQTPYSDLRYRQYYDTTERPTDEAPNEALRAVYSSPIDYTELQFDVVIEQIVAEGEKRRVNLSISLPPNSFYIDSAQNNLTEIEFSSNAFNRENMSVDQDSKIVKGNLRPETATRLTKEGLTQNLHMELSPGTYLLKCVVRDDLTGKIGSVSAPLAVK